FAPVLDVNTNPENPIISTRAFSDKSETTSALGTTMVETFMENGIASCGKHFPGHGSTSIDSHL
ncbi:MAG: beta-N-acetylhexosaminidase, partial [Candidatus Latescibacteria bacterium]|nr:beta-N-acetylhexosaminidase [Candidatus Latescibacterota bacterium]